MHRFLSAGLTLVALAVMGAPARAASPDDTRIAGAGAAIVDAFGSSWTLNNGYVYVNGTQDQRTANVIFLGYEGGRVWQENANHLWWYKVRPSDTWAPTLGTKTSPLPPITAKVSNGVLSVRADPATNVSIFAYNGNCYQCTNAGARSYPTGPLGNLVIPVASTGFSSATYWDISQLDRPIMTVPGGPLIAVPLHEYFASDDIYDNAPYNYGITPQLADWSALVNLASVRPGIWNLFATTYASPSAYPAEIYITYQGQERDGYGRRYVFCGFQTSTTIANINGQVFLDVDQNGYGRIAIASGTGTQGEGYQPYATGTVRITAPY